MNEKTARFSTSLVVFLVFAFLMLYMVPQLRPIVGEPQFFGLLQQLIEATGVPPSWIIGTLIASLIAVGTGLVLYLQMTGKLSEIL